MSLVWFGLVCLLFETPPRCDMPVILKVLLIYDETCSGILSGTYSKCNFDCWQSLPKGVENGNFVLLD